jgi:ketosteroid isomerase-like protein
MLLLEAATVVDRGLAAVRGVEESMPPIQSEIEALLDRWSDAIRRKTIDPLMSLYSPDIVYFDVIPPLRYSGATALRNDFLRWFDIWEGPVGVEIRDRRILASEDVAVAHMLHRTSGTLKDGREVAYWVRATVCCQRSNHRWFIAHEHVSLPIDFKSGSAVMDLVP